MRVASRSVFAACLSLLLTLTSHATYVYTDDDDGMTYDVKDCEILKGKPKGTPEQINCMENEGILEHWPDYIRGSISSNVGRTNEVLCRGQRGICESKYEYMTDLSNGCREMVQGCRSALRHLVEMMMKENKDEQVCNNFALKSVRGFFHDYMSSDIEGSVLSENHLDMNVGLCRWTQYINVLSDHTMCDAGSIITMAGYLGYEACGFKLFSADIDVKPYVYLNGGMMCSARTTGKDAAPKKTSHPLFDAVTGQRLEEFDDLTVSASSKSTEDFWCATNPHSCATGDRARSDGLSDGEVEYAGEATAAAHIIGRVTCPVSGKVAGEGTPPVIHPGFFHLPRGSKAKGVGMKALEEHVNEGYRRFSDTQCADSADFPGVPSSDGNVPPNGVRPSTSSWPLLSGETNLNSIGGLCGMPAQFLKTVRPGGRHRVPRFMNIAAESRYNVHTEVQKEKCEERHRKMYIPLELLTIRNDVQLPTSPALDRFLAIAYDGIGTITSAWDTCVVGCDIDVSQNRLCGGSGLSNFLWETTSTSSTSTPIISENAFTASTSSTSTPIISENAFPVSSGSQVPIVCTCFAYALFVLFNLL